MRSLLRFLIRYNSTILFLVLEVVAIILVARYNSFHKARLFKIRHVILGGISRKYDDYASYFSLNKENKALVQENAKLYNLLPDDYYNPISENTPDTSISKKYTFISARVINNSINKQYNFLTLNKGKKHGIEPDMAVICDRGIVGVVKETTENFSSVVSVLNREFNPYGVIQRNGYEGSVEWPGRAYNEVILRDIPIQVEVHVGDTIKTSENSAIFPKGILIGVIESYKPFDGTLYEIAVHLSTDFKSISNVMVIKNKLRTEQIQLESRVEND
jgi:rod shape-determining protein MreC